MGKKVFILMVTAVSVIILSDLALACGCGGGCGNGSGASSCQEAAQVSGGHSTATKGMAASATAVNVGNAICPVMGEKINDKDKVMYEYEGKVYNFCCGGCINEFNKDPQKYVKKSEELNNQ